MSARAEYAAVFAWIATQAEGVRPGDITRFVLATTGKRVTNPDGYLTQLEHNGFLLYEDEGRLFAWMG